MLCATVNDVTTTSSWRIDAAQQQQADEEQQVVGADQDVMDAGRDELSDDRERPWRAPAKYSRCGACRDRGSSATSAPRLRRRSRTSGASDRTETSPSSTATAPGGEIDRIANVKAHRLAFAQNLESVSIRASACGRPPRLADAGRAWPAWPSARSVDDRRVEQTFGRRDLKIVREVEDVRDERDVHSGPLELHVQVAERDRVGRHRGRPRQHRGEQHPAREHGAALGSNANAIFGNTEYAVPLPEREFSSRDVRAAPNSSAAQAARHILHAAARRITDRPFAIMSATNTTGNSRPLD